MQLTITEEKHLRICTTFELDFTGTLAHDAVRPISADDILCSNSLFELLVDAEERCIDTFRTTTEGISYQRVLNMA